MSEYVAYQYHQEICIEGPNLDRYSNVELTSRLNELGAQGWEMISIKSATSGLEIGLDTHYISTHIAYFKRPYIQRIEELNE